jgi:hypothetical protein
VSDLMVTADEKNHVITNANDELDHQLLRFDSIFPYIAGEIGEEARLGSLTHWAYSNKNSAKTAGSALNERPRREITSSNNQHLTHALHDAEVASRSEARREAVLARKQRRHHADSDFDETRMSGARKSAVTKVRTGIGGDPPSAPDSTATGIATTGATPAKRRRVEKPQTMLTGASMERSLSGANNSTGRATSKETPAADPMKKRIRAPSALASTGRKRYDPMMTRTVDAPHDADTTMLRNNTVTSAAGSPSLVSSPIVGTFNPPRSAASPGPSVPNRPQTSRMQPTSSSSQAAAATIVNGRQRPPSSSSSHVNNASMSSGPGLDLVIPSNAVPIADKAPDIKVTSKEAVAKEVTPQAPSDLNHETDIGGANTDANVTLSVATMEEDLKPRPTEYTRTNEPAASSVPAPGPGARSRSSKNSTPVVSTFSESAQPKSRPARNTDAGPAKRSHKKGGSLSITQPVAATATEDEDSSREGDDEDDEGEPRYCYCNGISFGEMVACDNDACPREWFHLSCVGLTKPPGKNGE